MSRLIDANKLPYEDIECTDGRTYMVVNAYDIENAPTVKAIPLGKVKKAREEMYEAAHADADGWETVIDLEDAFAILDKLIAESEEE